MDENTYHELCQQPDVMSRGSLLITNRVLSKVSPLLAGQIQLILSGKPLEAPSQIETMPHAEHFKIELDEEDVASIVRAINDYGIQLTNQALNLGGELFVTRGIMEEWQNAHKQSCLNS